MKKSHASLASSICSLLILVPSLARGECFEQASAPAQADCVVMPRGEMRGVWFSLEAAIKLQQSHLKLPEMEALVSQLEEVNTLKGEELELYKGVIAEHEQVKSSLEVQATDLARRLTRAEMARDAWHRSPWLWLGIGVGATLAAGVTLNVILE